MYQVRKYANKLLLLNELPRLVVSPTLTVKTKEFWDRFEKLLSTHLSVIIQSSNIENVYRRLSYHLDKDLTLSFKEAFGILFFHRLDPIKRVQEDTDYKQKFIRYVIRKKKNLI